MAVLSALLCACAEGAGLPVGGAVAAAAAAAVWPIAWPLAEVSLLAAKSGAQIEADVQLKEPIQVCTPPVLCPMRLLVPHSPVSGFFVVERWQGCFQSAISWLRRTQIKHT